MVLLLVTVLLAGGALTIKYKLEGLRVVVEREVQSRTGAQFRAGAVLVNGLRGLRIDDVQVGIETESGPSVQFVAPVAYVHLDIVELLYGDVLIEGIEADGATIKVVRPSDRSWFASQNFDFPEFSHLVKMPSFRFMGKDGTLDVSNVVGDSHLLVDQFAFDVSRLEGSPDFNVKLSGNVAPGTGQNFKVDLRFASMEDFDLRMHCAEVTAQDVSGILPASSRLLNSGTIEPSVRISGYPDMTLIVAFEAPFQDVALSNQPAFLMPADGTLRGVAQYDTAQHLLTVTAAKAESYQIGGNIEGSISFAQMPPVLDLKLEAAHLPLKDAVASSIAGRADQYGALDVTLQEPYQIQMSLKGTLDKPVIGLQGDVAGGTFRFVPKEPMYPKGTLTLGRMTLNWSSDGTSPMGAFAITDGKFTYQGIEAGKVSGTLTLGTDKVSIDPLNAEITGNPFVGSLKHDLKTKRTELAVSGTFKGLESTAIARAGSLSVSGAANVRGTIVKDAKGITLDGELDATQAELKYDPWLLKRPGVGASGKKIHAQINPAKGADFTAEFSIAGGQGKVDGRFDKQKAWRLTHLLANADKLDVSSVGQVVQSPYRVSGGSGREGTLEFTRTGAADTAWQLKAGVTLDDLSLLAEGAETPMHVEGVQAAVEMSNEPEAVGAVNLKVAKAQMPPLRGPWFTSMKNREKSDRRWTFDLAGDAVDVPPWKGTQFKGRAYVERKKAGFTSYEAAVVGGGKVTGSYHRLREDNIYEVDMNWDEIPITYLLDQLNYPHVLSGTSTGQLNYSMDRDDPRTIKGKGKFSIASGQFSADYLISQLEGRIEKNQLTSLPLSLRFDQLESRVELEKDVVKTSGMALRSQGIKVTGDGMFVLHGDMDYDLKVALSPDVAEKIPAIRDNLNVKGLRMAQQDVELAFKVKGPTFNPQGELTGTPPVGVTLVSSALELTSEAVGVIDIPRKVLLDLLRIGGGIVGMK